MTEKTGTLVAFKSVNDEEDLVIINKSGITLRIRLEAVPVRGRATMGVKIINLDKRGDDIASVCVVPTDPEEETAEVAEEARIEVDEEIVSETSEIEEDAEEIDEIEDNAENSEE